MTAPAPTALRVLRPDPAWAPLLDRLAACGLPAGEGPGALTLVPADLPVEALPDGPVLVLGPLRPGALADRAGLVLGEPLPPHEVRLRPGPDGEVGVRSGGDVLVRAAWPRVDKAADDVEVLLTASAAFRDHPVATWRPGTGTAVLSLDAGWAEPVLQRLVHRLVRHVLGQRDGAPVRVGLLGYGAVGAEHAAAVAAVEGLELAAVCDLSPTRLEAARSVAPDVRGTADPEELLADDGVDLVVVSTPPSTHADWVLRCLTAGRSVVVEKPFCLTVEEADRQVAAAAERGLALAVYQNRRWDPDYLEVKRVVRSGQLGEVFAYESFVGGHDHPCNYWHSHEEISGGAIYDWGSHYLDWVLDLFPQPVLRVSATAHKRRWHDVTNADHTRVLLQLEGGLEAEFTHSDLAAARKPKWWVLGTEGALVGDWREERVVGRTPVGTLAEDRLAASDSPADLRVLTPNGSGRTHETALALPPAPRHPFHRELADLLLSGAPMSVTPAGSRRGVAVMQAATESAARGGDWVEPPA